MGGGMPVNHGLGGGMLIMERDFRGFPKAGTQTLVPNLTGE